MSEASRTEPSYKGLKLIVNLSKHISSTSTEPSYKGLKLIKRYELEETSRTEPSYKGLKRNTVHNEDCEYLVPNLPIRD